MSNIAALLDVQSFTYMMRGRYRKNLVRLINSKNPKTEDRTQDNNKIMQQIFCIKLFQLFRLIVFILFLAYLLGSMWFLLTKHLTKSPDEFTFYNEYGMEDYTDFEKVSVLMYFMFTTLSTVGFGDYNPKSEPERIAMTFILLIGVACFAYIMSQLIEILLEVQSITASNEDGEMLSRWILILQNFNKNKPLPAEMVAKFERYFEYFWANDKNYACASQSDQEILDELPQKIQSQIYKDFLFQDFLDQFSVHFYLTKPETQQPKHGLTQYYKWQDNDYSSFMINFLKCLEPRIYSSGEYIFEEGDDVDEHIFVISRDLRKPINSTGVYVIGFTNTHSQAKEKYFHVKLGPKTMIGAYENLYGKKAEFTYKTTMQMDAFGLRKIQLKDLFEDNTDFRG